MNKTAQRLFTHAGLVASIVIFAGLVIMHFIPPIAPHASAAQVQKVYEDHSFRIRLGALLILISGMFVAPFAAQIFMQLRRMEGRERPVCAFGQLGSGIANAQFFLLPGVFFAITAFRPDRPAATLLSLNDTAWLMTMFPWTTGAMQCACTGLGILINNAKSNAYPRWLGYFNFWIAASMATSSVVIFFHSGPFSWKGVIGFWVPVTVFGVWMIVMWWMTLKAVDSDDGE